MKTLRSGFTATLLVGLLYSLPSSGAPKKAPPKAPPVTPEEKKKRRDWSDSMLRKAAPKKGCFRSAYPKTEWQEVPCVAAPNVPAPPRHGGRPAVVGNSNDVSAQAPSGHITQAIGHF